MQQKGAHYTPRKNYQSRHPDWWRGNILNTNMCSIELLQNVLAVTHFAAFLILDFTNPDYI